MYRQCTAESPGGFKPLGPRVGVRRAATERRAFSLEISLKSLAVMSALSGEVSFGAGFSDVDTSTFKLLEVDEAMLQYLSSGGTLQIKAQPG